MEKKLPLSAALCTIDAEKAFDCIEWPFMFSILQKYGFGTNFIQWITVRTNDLSKPFTLHRGTKQGLLLNLIVKPLAEKIGSENNIKGILIGSKTYKVSLYCDDIIFIFGGCGNLTFSPQSDDQYGSL